MQKFKELILLVVLLTPCMPKIGFTDKISIFPAEILLILAFPLLIRKKFFLKKTLLVFWGCISLSTIMSFLYGPIEIGGAMRCIKGMIYIPLVYIAMTSKKYSYHNMAYIVIVAAIINVVFHVWQGFSIANTELWNSDILVSGLSGWSYNLALGDFVKQGSGGSHGIWGDYCVVALCATWLSYLTKRISKTTFVSVMLAVIVSLGLSVSREALVVFVCVILSYVIANTYYRGKFHISAKAYCFIAVLAFVITWVVIKYGDHIVMFQKMVYMVESLQSTGDEQNVSLRVGAWTIFILSLIKNPWAILTGYGFNLENYARCIRGIAREARLVDAYVPLPESFFVEAWCFGGVLCFVFAIIFWRSIYFFFKKERQYERRCLLIGLFVGLLIASVFSGAAIISDLLYGQFLIFIGFLLRERTTQCKRRAMKTHKVIK